MSITVDLIKEMERCQGALVKYLMGAIKNPNPAHAAAYRATLDLTRLLAAWRKAPVVWNRAK